MALYIVATPIGNLEDITLRALRMLKEVDLIACEDTRQTKKLLTHYDIHKPLTSYYQHSKLEKVELLLTWLKEGKNIALVTDSGTPGISDPGFVIINRAIEEGIEVIPLPGPSALITAVIASGLPANGFVFWGFLPRKKGKIKKELWKAAQAGKTIIVYESPFRLLATLKIISETLVDCEVAVARELTKKFEEIIRGKVTEVMEKIKDRQIKGEIVIVISPLAGKN
ncbi:MAG: 16S rRNA (cytidine(1402)-2'-O)-methyltransferase [bacterium]